MYDEKIKPNNPTIPLFTKEVVAKNLRDGYWLEAADLNQNGKTDLFGYGLTLGELYWYENPDWKKHLIIDKIKGSSSLHVDLA